MASNVPLAPGEPAPVGDVARAVMGAMIADPNKLPDGFGKAIVSNEKGDVVYVLAIILGGSNVANTATVLQRLQELTLPATDVFAEDGEPKAKKKKKRRKPRIRQRFRPARGDSH